MLSTPASSTASRSFWAVSPKGGADDGVDLCHADAVDVITNRQHMGGGNGGDAQLMQRQHRKPVFVVALEHQHHPVSPAQPRRAEYISHAVGVLLHIGKGKNMFLIFRVAPDHGQFFRGFGGDGVHNVVGKVKIVRIMEGNAL